MPPCTQALLWAKRVKNLKEDTGGQTGDVPNLGFIYVKTTDEY